MFDNLLKPEHLIIILVIALLIFGPSKLPGLGKGLGEAFRGFKEGIKGSPDNPDAAKQQENTAAKSENASVDCGPRLDEVWNRLKSATSSRPITIQRARFLPKLFNARAFRSSLGSPRLAVMPAARRALCHKKTN